MKFRPILFWAHLSCGVGGGLVILMMSVSGVLLTYERQMVAWADRTGMVTPVPSGIRLPLEALLGSVQKYADDRSPVSIIVPADPEAAVAVALSRHRVVYVDPYTGEVLGEGAAGIHRFFGTVTGLHRWFNVGEESRGMARAITGASNLLFGFLVLSGMYLWLPRFYKWSQFRMRVLFAKKVATTRARDFNWHHVFGIWSSIPLALVVASATVFSYPWANNLVFRAFGEEPPARGAPPAGNPNQPAADHPTQGLELERLFLRASEQVSGWKTITLRFSPAPVETVSFVIDRGNGGQPHLQSTLILDVVTAAVIRHEAFGDLTPGRQARSIIRHLHTGEVYGVAGQTIAGLVSLAAVMLVWTGLALAYRRLVQPRLKK